MQGKFSLFTELWDGVCQLKTELANCLEAFENGDFSRIGVGTLQQNEKETFIATIRATLTNMSVRFPCPSSSLNKRQLRNRVACREGSVDMRVVARAFTSCPLRLLFDVYIFPDEFLRDSTIKEYLLNSFNGEVRRLCIAMSGKKEAIMSDFTDNSANTDTAADRRTRKITLDDVFQHINVSSFPLLWKSVLEVRAVNPTTVSCEQSFSCLKHSNHVNMKSENLCSLVVLRLTIRGNETMSTQLTQQTHNE